MPVLLLAAAVPLRHVRLASNLLVLASSLFIATQLVMIYRPAANPVPIASPLAEEWLVGQGGTPNSSTTTTSPPLSGMLTTFC
ncbi:MAG TPA: hypothetical protein VFP01_00610, partial [Propionibacteriaceae bacterium]|nr:hypothetical protein [Propionibacteriaceae bacterium]